MNCMYMDKRLLLILMLKFQFTLFILVICTVYVNNVVLICI